MSPITTGIRPPLRSRTFTEADAQQAHEALVAYQQAGNTNEGVGYGSFSSQESARSAGAALNRMIGQLGLSDHKWATTVFADPSEDGKFVGVMLAKVAKAAPAPKGSKKNGNKRSK